MTAEANKTPADPIALIRRRLEMVEADDARPGVRDSVRRHCEHLESLAANLRKLGMDERAVSAEIAQIFKQYERALTDYIKAA